LADITIFLTSSSERRKDLEPRWKKLHNTVESWISTGTWIEL